MHKIDELFRLKKLRIQGLIILLAMVGWSCGATKTMTLDHPGANSALWVQNSAEYEAITIQIYKTAASNLSLPLEDSFWTASVEQENRSFHKLPPAVILDVDETVLDNSPFEARLIKQNETFNPENWSAWVEEANADPVKGALAFTTYAASRNVTVFYITNRDHSGENATRENLEKLGFPLAAGKDVLLTKNERENWGSDKSSRRAFVAENYRILMLFGDNLNDFIPAADISQQERSRLVEKHKEKWGRKWFMLPNPMYGSWEQALYDFDSTLTEEQVRDAKEKRLNTKN